MITNGLVTGSQVYPGGLPGDRSGSDAGETNPTLLDRVRDWRNHRAWAEFHDRYDPLLHRWCSRFSFDADTADELCQRIWVELMARMRSFRYDPSRGFRRWLWRLFHSRAIDLLRSRRVMQWHSYEGLPFDPPGLAPARSRSGRDRRCRGAPGLARPGPRGRAGPGGGPRTGRCRDLGRLLDRRHRGPADPGGRRLPRQILHGHLRRLPAR